MQERIKHEKWFKFNGLKFKAVLTTIDGANKISIYPSRDATEWLEQDENNYVLVMVQVARLFKLPPPESAEERNQNRSRFLDRLNASVN